MLAGYRQRIIKYIIKNNILSAPDMIDHIRSLAILDNTYSSSTGYKYIDHEDDIMFVEDLFITKTTKYKNSIYVLDQKHVGL